MTTTTARSAPELRAIDLAHAGTKLQVLPELGGKIASLTMGGRQWLWTSEVLPFRLPVAGTSYVETADSGGFDECFPTVGPCHLPPQVAGGVALPDHGELWSQTCAVHTPDGAEGRALVCGWRTHILPARFTRTLTIEDDGSLRTDYRVDNEGAAPLPFLWSAHPLLPLTDDTVIEVAAGTRLRVDAMHGLEVAGREHRWPTVALRGGGALDVSRPAARAEPYAIKLFLSSPGTVSITQGGVTLSSAFDPASVDAFGLWLNRGGWTPFTDEQPYTNLAFEPCIGAPDSLADALEVWGAAHWLDAGASRAWTVRWRAR